MQARQNGKPVVLEFYTTWCGPCKRFARETLPSPEVRKALTGVNFVRYDAERPPGEAAATRYGVSSYPSILLLDGSGALCAVAGDWTVKPFVALLNQAAALTGSKEAVRASLATQPDNPEALLSAARWHVAHRDLADVPSFYERAANGTKDPATAAQIRWEAAKLGRFLEARRRLVVDAAEQVRRSPGTRSAGRALRLAVLSGELSPPQAAELLALHVAALPAMPAEKPTGADKPVEDDNAPAPILKEAAETALAAQASAQALEILRRIVAAAPKTAGTHELLVQAHHDLHDSPAAQAQLELALADSKSWRQRQQLRALQRALRAGEPILVKEVRYTRLLVSRYLEGLEGSKWIDGVDSRSQLLMSGER